MHTLQQVRRIIGGGAKFCRERVTRVLRASGKSHRDDQIFPGPRHRQNFVEFTLVVDSVAKNAVLTFGDFDRRARFDRIVEEHAGRFAEQARDIDDLADRSDVEVGNPASYKVVSTAGCGLHFTA